MPDLKLVPNVIPIDVGYRRRARMLDAVGRVLAKKGFEALDADCVAREAGVLRKDIFKSFGGLKRLVAEFGNSDRFWPSAEELIGNDLEELQDMPAHEIMAEFFKRYLAALRNRPQTLRILAWEEVERNQYSEVLEGVRVRTALQFFENMRQDPPEDIDLTALVLIMAGAVNYIAVRSRVHHSLGGVDLQSEKGWKRIEETIEKIMQGTLGETRAGDEAG
ncbi:TetR/AcrR family transcriptional regulator [Salidesulfovibrio onnuriiensis]|uniref:TetR/AcrR family transcriptional regulator n=1 Tax=Salidesulfovibrio onnuriiensis TaxID=2583823 RepID=UPI0011C8B9DD|nr:TetR/AcrR family transcriptional regulator [Salidesulfovibrio onnuriiensis]